MKTLAFAATALGLALTTAPAFATEREQMSVDISVEDLDLTTPKGQKQLDRRIEQAARTVCRTTRPTTGSRVMSHEARSCLAKARAQAREQVAALIEDQRRGG